MRLKRIEIDSYKSIIDQKIDIDENCIGFVGKNESGKSNILNAIGTLDWTIQPTNKDRSKLSGKLPRIRFLFDSLVFDGAEIWSDIEGDFSDSLLNRIVDFDSLNVSDVVQTNEMSDDGNNISVYNFHFFYKTKDIKSYSIVIPGITIPSGASIKINENLHKIEDGLIVPNSSITEGLESYFEPISKKHIDTIIKYWIEFNLKHYKPRVVFWEYESKYLIPSEIEYDDFIVENKPWNVSRPLYNIFTLTRPLNIHGIDALKKKIDLWRIDSSQRRKDVQIINEEVNKYIKSIWEDYDQIFEISLEQNGITIHIHDPNSTEKNYYEMVERSQGFKTFISFLLTIAAENHKKRKKTNILILDEPETHLHPSGVSFMRKELQRLSEKNNQVFFATHSIFMIDRKNLKRNIIVSKRNEYTSLKRVSRDSITQESVIYEALGTRVDEFSIKNKNIIFEGMLDKTILNWFLNSCIEKKSNPFKIYEFLDGGGTKEIYQFFSDKVIPEQSEWVLILDNDKPGRNLYNQLEKKYPNKFNNGIYLHFYSETEGMELEDLLPSETIEKVFNAAKDLLDPSLEVNFKVTEGKIISNQIQEYYSRNDLPEGKKKDLEKRFKNSLESEIESHLSEIGKHRTVSARNDLFARTFPKYYTFALSLIKKYSTP